jgi:hypothetical protein
MTDLIEQPAFWLNVTNAALGVFCAIVILYVAAAALRDRVSHRRDR